MAIPFGLIVWKLELTVPRLTRRNLKKYVKANAILFEIVQNETKHNKLKLNLWYSAALSSGTVTPVGDPHITGTAMTSMTTMTMMMSVFAVNSRMLGFSFTSHDSLESSFLSCCVFYDPLGTVGFVHCVAAFNVVVVSVLLLGFVVFGMGVVHSVFKVVVCRRLNIIKGSKQYVPKKSSTYEGVTLMVPPMPMPMSIWEGQSSSDCKGYIEKDLKIVILEIFKGCC